jgi:hypothetical protein
MMIISAFIRSSSRSNTSEVGAGRPGHYESTSVTTELLVTTFSGQITC